MTPLEDLLREALAEFATRVQPRPALHLIRMRAAAAGEAATAGLTPDCPHERTRT